MWCKKRPSENRGPFALLALFDDCLGARFFMLLLDHCRAVGRLTLLDYGPIAVTIVIPRFANCDASTNPPGADTNTNFVSQSGSGKCGYGSKYQSVSHGFLLCCFRRGEIPAVA